MSIYERAILKWGARSQVSMAMGECGELIAELNRYFIQQRSTPEAVVGEIADVQIMLNQLKTMFGERDVDKAVNKKLSRLEAIIDGTIHHPHEGVDKGA